MRFDLHSPALAQYHWGTLFCRFSPAAPVDKRTFLKIVASSVQGQAYWSTDEEFRAGAAFLHETAHLAQDLSTGLGHSDYVAHKTHTSQLLRYASIVVDFEGVASRPPYRQPGACRGFDDKQDPIVSEAQSQLLYYPFAKVPPERIGRIRDLLEHDLKRPVDDEALFDFSTQCILESDAALSVLLHLRALDMTAEQQEILQRNAAVVVQDSLGPEYGKAAWHLQAVLEHHADLDDRQMDLIMPSVFGLLVDSALACPPRDWIAARGESAEAYEPGVKYVRLLVAFQKLVGTGIEGFWSAMAGGRHVEAEALLLANAPFPYPSSETINEAWIEALETLGSLSMVAGIRQSACRYRQSNGVLSVRRNIQLLIGMQAPILYLHKDHGFIKHDWGERILPDNDIGLTRELLDHFMVMELAEFLFRTGEFRCPHAQADICPVVEDSCTSGYVHLAQFPESPRCSARGLLSRCGVNMPDV